MPKLKELLFGKKGKNKQLATKTKDQQQLAKLITQGLTKDKGPLADIYGQFDEEAFKEGVTDPQIKQFQEQILPQLQEQLNANGQVLSNAFGRESMKAGNDLQSRLASLMYEAKQGQKQNRISGANTLYGSQNIENLYRKSTTGAVQAGLNAGAEQLGKNAVGQGNAGGAGGTATAAQLG